jgi:septal ring factor EnvC (AmiA/AmiB activator)
MNHLRYPARTARLRKTGVLLIALLLPLPALAQEDRATTERRLRELRGQISSDEQRLSHTQAAERSGAARINEVNREIALREELVGTYRLRMEQLAYELDSLTTSITQMEATLRHVQREYQERARHAYQYGRLHDLALILSASSVNQMLVRVRYLNRFSQQRKRQVHQINQTAATLHERKARLDEMLATNEAMLRDAETEQQTLARLRKDRQQMLQRLQSERTTLEASLTRNRSLVRELEQRIQSIVAANTQRRRNTNPGTPPTASSPDLTPLGQADVSTLTSGFAQRKGRLPWPVSGRIREPYGTVVNREHGTTTPNPGILIGSAASAEVKAVYEGRVLSVDLMPELGTFLILEHGDYYSVYANFSLLYVSKGDRVQAGQVLGRAGTEAEPKGNGLFFGLFREGQALDPTPWLAQR